MGVSDVLSGELEPEEHALAITMRALTARQRRITSMNTRRRNARSLNRVRMGPHMMLPGDGAAVKGAKVQRASLRRVWVFAAPYRSDIIVFLAAICVSAL